MNTGSNWTIMTAIIIGAGNMILNIIRYSRFLKNTTDVISVADHRSKALRQMGLVLLLFFLTGYVLVAVFGKPDYMTAGILLGGSLFVSIVLKLMFNLVDMIKARTLEICETLISVIEARDSNLNGHSIYVRNLTLLIYEYLPEEMKENMNAISLEYAALMHDIGKLGVPESILQKPGKLSAEEWSIMKEHPNIGVNILSPITSFEIIRPWILQHHERIDGKGYYGIRQQDISPEARIICVADSYSAITMRRSYKEPKSYEEAIEILKECSGSQFAPEIVEVFLKIPKEKVLACVPERVDVSPNQ